MSPIPCSTSRRVANRLAPRLLLLIVLAVLLGLSFAWPQRPVAKAAITMATSQASNVYFTIPIRHSVEVEAEGLYEASVLGLCAFRKHELEPGGLTQLEVEVRSSVKHTLPVTKVREWLQRGVRSPKEAVLKERLRTLLSA